MNKDFRYQLTTIGQQAQVWVAREIAQNQFSIKSDKPNVKISWQVTGIRQDAWANANRIVTEVDKVGEEKGKYLHPAAFGKDASMSETFGIDEQNTKIIAQQKALKVKDTANQSSKAVTRSGLQVQPSVINPQ